VERTSHYQSNGSPFLLFSQPSAPSWRTPQLGALSAVLAQWTLDPTERLLVSMPTGSGKTAVETALPYLAQARRVLVVVPSVELRSQLAAAFRTEEVLRRLGALGMTSLKPTVETVTARKIDWTQLATADVVVALPQSISPAHFPEGEQPDPGFFDLIIIDEAHHSPAPTWRAVLDHFHGARAVLLTATPLRNDGKRVPGSHIFHYPLRRAIADGIYQVVEPQLVQVPEGISADGRDQHIAQAVIEMALSETHRTSAILIRTNSVARASKLQTLYRHLGLEPEILTSSVPANERESIIRRWRSSELRAVIAVDMLAEGFDLPNLRIVGYHDKHRSVPVTMQFIGRLARATKQFPQPSVLVTARDNEIYPFLQTALAQLYAEDADWATLLPGLIDDRIEGERLDAQYLAAFAEPSTELSLAALAPLARAQIFEGKTDSSWEPTFVAEGELPSELQLGARIGREFVAYAGLNEAQTHLVLITYELETPRWYQGDDGLTRAVYDLHVISWHPTSHVTHPDLLLINSRDDGMSVAIRDILDPEKTLRSSNPRSLQSAFDSLERLSVSSVGVRNTFAGTPGTPAYSMFSGSGIERGLSDSDTGSKALGHAMAQVELAAGSSVTAGLATSKSKYWETRYLNLRAYEAFSIDLASRYWFPRNTTSGPLLPEVAKGIRTETFPIGVTIVAAELHPGLRGQGWHCADDGPSLDMLEIEGISDSVNATELRLQITHPEDPGTSLWAGTMDITGRVRSDSGSSRLNRGAGQLYSIDELFLQMPPTVYFLNGDTIFGAMTYPPVSTSNRLPPIDYNPIDWSGVDITTEAKKHGRSDTIHDHVENMLMSTLAASGTDRWVLCNDGKGEIADHIVIERVVGQRPRVELWHSKFASSTTPRVRVEDMQVVTAQAAKSRRHFTDSEFWKRLGRRLDGKEGPTAHLLSGSREDLRALCGLDPDRQDDSFAKRPPSIDGRVVVVQPGLSYASLVQGLEAESVSIATGQVREFLTFLDSAIRPQGAVGLVCSP
jgi:superfamily II DNA or RNA helicase